MKKSLQLLLAAGVIVSGCAGSRLSHDDARRKIAELSRSDLVPDSVEINRIVSQTDNEVIAESSVTLAVQFKKDPNGVWNVTAVRLGDRDWIDVNELLAALNGDRRRETLIAMEKVVQGIAEYRKTNNTLPQAADIVKLTDVLHPQYMNDLIRTDAWGNPIEYELRGSTFRLVSRGADGQRGTADDIVLQDGSTS
jgi:hypothetical protein